MAGQKGYTDAQQQALTGMLTKQKIQEYRRKQKQLASFQTLLGGGGAATTAAAPSAAASMPAMRVGPTVERAAMAAQQNVSPQSLMAVQQMPQARKESAFQSMVSQLSGPERAAYLGMGVEKGLAALLDRFQQTATPMTAEQKAQFNIPQNIGATITPSGAIDIPYKPDLQTQNIPGVGLVTFDPYQSMYGGAPAAAPAGATSVAPQQAPLSTAQQKIAGAPVGSKVLFSERLSLKDKRDLEKDMASSWRTQSQDITESLSQYRKLESAYQQKTGAGDVALVFSFMKVLDPRSVVREGEFATAEQVGGVASQYLNLYNRVVSGERLTDLARNQILDAAQSFINSQRDLVGAKFDTFKNQAEADGLSLVRARVTNPFEGFQFKAQSNAIPGLAEAQAAAPSGSDVKMEQGTNKLAYDLDGKRYYWNHTKGKWETN